MATDVEKAKAALQTARAEIEHFVAMSEDARSVVELDQVSVGRLIRMDAKALPAKVASPEPIRRAAKQAVRSVLRFNAT